jgi:hypothetical protein
VRIAYRTTDEVNADLALRLAEAFNLTLDPVTPAKPTDDEWFDAVLWDLDYLPAEWREQVLGQLRAAPPPYPVVVHSYHLDAQEAEGLRSNGVAVHRRLQPRLFRRLARILDRQWLCPAADGLTSSVNIRR